MAWKMDVFCMASAFVGLLLYSNTLWADFAYDDRWVSVLVIQSIVLGAFFVGKQCAVLIFERKFSK